MVERGVGRDCLWVDEEVTEEVLEAERRSRLENSSEAGGAFSLY